MSIVMPNDQSPRREDVNSEQVADDIGTLNQSLIDFDLVSEIYHPGPYWKRHQAPLVKYLREHGLTDMRSGTTDKADPKYILRRFGAAELAVETPEGHTIESWNTRRYEIAAAFGERTGARPLSSLSVSIAGNPSDLIVINGQNYTSLALSYYIRYAYICQFVDFDEIDVLVEIGPGGGMQTEILHKLHPHLSSYLFDIPPQSYVCTQYLKAALPGRVMGIAETRGTTKLPQPQSGKVHIFNSWQIGLVTDTPIDLFWNSASFNEMEPGLVGNYLACIAPSVSRLYLMSIMQGSRVGMDDYLSFLPDFDLANVEPVIDHTGNAMHPYSNSFWTRKPARPVSPAAAKSSP